MAKVARSLRIDEQIWTDAQKIAELYDMSMSGLISACLLQIAREHADSGPVDLIRRSPLK